MVHTWSLHSKNKHLSSIFEFYNRPGDARLKVIPSVQQHNRVGCWDDACYQNAISYEGYNFFCPMLCFFRLWRLIVDFWFGFLFEVLFFLSIWGEISLRFWFRSSTYFELNSYSPVSSAASFWLGSMKYNNTSTSPYISPWCLGPNALLYIFM